MKCFEAQEIFSAYLDKDLDCESVAAFEKHLDSCNECTAILTEIAGIITELGNLPDADPPAGLNDRVILRTLKTKRISLLDAMLEAVLNPGLDAAAILILGFFITFGSYLCRPTDASELYRNARAFASVKVIESQSVCREGVNYIQSVSVTGLPFYKEAKEAYVKIESNISKESMKNDGKK